MEDIEGIGKKIFETMSKKDRSLFEECVQESIRLERKKLKDWYHG